MTNNTNWAIYARVSTEDQAEKYSLASQIRACRQKIGAAVPDNRIFVDDCTGSDTNRPELQKLRDLVDAKRLAGVMVYSIDRFSRDVLDAIHLNRTFKSKDCKLEFVNLTIDDSPVGEFMFTLMAGIAQLERRTILERTERGRTQKAMKGFLHCGSVPYGYRYKGLADGDRGSMVIYEPEAKIVRQMFDWAAEGIRPYQIKNRLNEMQIPSAKGGAWSDWVIRKILSNPTYIGNAIYARHSENPIDIPCPAIIDKLHFQRVQLNLQQHREGKRGGGRRPSYRYLLTSLIWCGRCGQRMKTFVYNPPYSYYRCGNIDRKIYKRNCHSSGIKIKTLDRVVWNSVWDAITDPKTLLELAREYYDEMNRDDGKRDSLIQRIDRLKRMEKRGEEVLLDPDTPICYAKAKANLDKIQAEIPVLENELMQMSKLSRLPAAQEIARISKLLKKGRHLKDMEDRKIALDQIVSKIIYADGQVTIEANIPLETEQSPLPNSHRRLNTGASYTGIPFTLKRRVS